MNNALEIARFILNLYGLGSDAFVAFLKRLFDKGSVPAEAQTRIIDWLQSNLEVSEERASSIALLIIAEIKSGDPGYNAEAGGLA